VVSAADPYSRNLDFPDRIIIIIITIILIVISFMSYSLKSYFLLRFFQQSAVGLRQYFLFPYAPQVLLD
jgi:hypothetical protein